MILRINLWLRSLLFLPFLPINVPVAVEIIEFSVFATTTTAPVGGHQIRIAQTSLQSIAAAAGGGGIQNTDTTFTGSTTANTHNFSAIPKMSR